MESCLKMLVLVLVLLLVSCETAPIGSWQAADTHAEVIGDRVTAAATQVSGSAGEIMVTARAGRAATPEPVRPKLDPFWGRIIASAQLMLAQGEALQGVRKDIDGLRVEVQAGKRELAESKAANADLQHKLDKANGRWEKGLQTVSWLALAGIGIAVAVGVMMHDFRISIAGGAGGLAVVIACMIVGELLHWLPWIAGGIVAVVVLWVGVESLFRGSLAAALRTSPAQDVADLLTHGAGTTPISASAGVGQAVPAPVVLSAGQVTGPAAAAVEDER